MEREERDTEREKRNMEREEREDSHEDDDKTVLNKIKSHSNTLAICNWLVNDRPDILRLAHNMLEAKLLPSSSSGLSGGSSINFFSSSQVKPVIFIGSTLHVFQDYNIIILFILIFFL